jgi:hypothetical protein
MQAWRHHVGPNNAGAQTSFIPMVPYRFLFAAIMVFCAD